MASWIRPWSKYSTRCCVKIRISLACYIGPSPRYLYAFPGLVVCLCCLCSTRVCHVSPRSRLFQWLRYKCLELEGGSTSDFNPVSARTRPMASTKGRLSLAANISERSYKELVHDILVSINCGLLVAMRRIKSMAKRRAHPKSITRTVSTAAS